jgi:hypothetical protein
MGAARLLIPRLSSLKVGGQALQAAVAMLGVIRKRVDQSVGGVVDLAQSDRRVFPPATAPFGGIRTNDLPS